MYQNASSNIANQSQRVPLGVYRSTPSAAPPINETYEGAAPTLDPESQKVADLSKMRYAMGAKKALTDIGDLFGAGLGKV